MNVSFAPLGLSDVPLLTAWLQAPHVRAFWDDGERDEAAVRAHYFAPGREAPAFVFYVDGVPAGFLQTYPVGPDAAFSAHAAPVGETWGVDLLIGDLEQTGRGLGPVVIGAFLRFWHSERGGVIRRFLIDPDAGNGPAVRAYAKAGFTAVGRVGPLLLMALDVPGGPVQ